MNIVEELSNNNPENYNRYLKRMTDSIRYSTKGLIPLLAKGGKKILDVGCGSGVMLESLEKENKDAKLTGIDLNMEAIKRLLTLDKKWKLYHMDFMDIKNKSYDTIIFSSILHEISSYHKDLEKRFTEKPIYDAFVKANELLLDNGSIILRDGLLTPNNISDHKLIISFINKEDKDILYRFQKEFHGFDHMEVNKDIVELNDNRIMISERFLKEFLYTYTWGIESFDREVNERFGILTKVDWLSLLKEAGFKIKTVIESREEYEKYLSKKINIYETDNRLYEYPNMTITIKATKIKSLKK